MNTGQGPTFSWVCQACGQVGYSGQAHACGGNPYPQWPQRGQWPQMPPTYQAPWTAFTLEDIRRIVREELDRKSDAPSDSAPVPPTGE